MAKKQTEEKVPAEAVEEPQAQPNPSMYVRIVNFAKAPRQFPLTNGRSVSCGPMLPGGDLHKSEPVLRKHVGDILRKMAQRGLIGIEPVEGA